MIKKLLLGLTVLLLVGCFASVDQNEEGFVYNKWSGDDKQAKNYSGGTHSIGFNDEMITHSLEIQSKEYSANVLSSNGLNVGIKIKINWLNKPNTVSQHYKLYGLKGEAKFIDPVVQGTLKDVIGKYLPEEIYSTKREKIEIDIINEVNNKFNQSEIFELKLIEILDVDLPKSIVTAIETKVREEQTTLEEEQKARTVTAKGLSKIESAKADLEAAKLKAEQNRVLSNSITSEILKLKEIELKEKTIQKWDGKYPKVIGGESDMLLDIGEQ